MKCASFQQDNLILFWGLAKKKNMTYFDSLIFQGVMEEDVVLTGDNAFNAHFGESIAAIGDIDDDGYQGMSVCLSSVCLSVLVYYIQSPHQNRLRLW